MRIMQLTMVILFCMVNCRERSELVIIGENSSNLNALSYLSKEYADKHGQIIRFQPELFEVALQKANQDLTNKTGFYDIVLGYNFSLSSYVRNDFVYKVSDLKALGLVENEVESNLFFQNAWKEIGWYWKDSSDTLQGEIPIGYPFATNTMLLCYNKSMYKNRGSEYKDKYGIALEAPKTWEEFTRQASFFSSHEGEYGVSLTGAEGGWLYYELCNFAFGCGGRVMDKKYGWQGNLDSEILIDSPEFQKGVEIYIGLKKYNAGDFFTADAGQQRERVRGGKIAMSIMWSDYLYDLTMKNGTNSDEFAFAPIPGDFSMLAGGIFYINKNTKKPKEAYAYIKEMLSKDNQVKMMRHGLCSPLKEAYMDPEVLSLPYAAALNESLSRGVYMLEAGPDAQIISDALTSYVQKMWKGSIDVKSGLKSAKEEIIRKRIELYANISE